MFKKVLTALALTGLCVGASACKVKQTQEAKLPDVEVSAKPGQMPAYDVKGPEVKVGSEKKTVEVPTVKVKTPN